MLLVVAYVLCSVEIVRGAGQDEGIELECRYCNSEDVPDARA